MLFLVGLEEVALHLLLAKTLKRVAFGHAGFDLHSSISEQQSLAQNCFSCAGVFCVAQLVLLKGALQIVLKGALHLTDYVTKVMERLSDEGVDPKVVLAA